MFARTIGQNELAPRQGSDRIGEHWIGKKRGTIDVMREIEKIFGSDVMLFHQAAQGGPVTLIVIFLQRAGRHSIKPEDSAKVERDSLIDLRP
jgi:hypothetical protein